MAVMEQLPQPGRAAIIGWGMSGRAAGRALSSRGWDVTGFDQHDVAENNDRVEVIADADELATRVVQTAPDLIVMSPGIAPHEPVWQSALSADIPVVGEMELAWLLQESGLHAGRPWLMVTGTNGKTTTVSMLAAMLRAGGENALEVGNIGVPITQLIDDDADVFAVEASSFQLYSTRTVSPEASVVLNVDADHLNWHGSVEALSLIHISEPTRPY